MGEYYLSVAFLASFFYSTKRVHYLHLSINNFFIATAIQHLSTENGLRERNKWSDVKAAPHNDLPVKLKLAILRGETIYRQKFFDFFDSKGFDDGFTYLAFQKMFIDSHMLAKFFQQIGLPAITKTI